MSPEPVAEVRRQHLVSKVLLKRWAVDGELLAFNLDDGTQRLRSPKAEGFQEQFIRHGSGRAEDRWRIIEDRAHRALSAVEAGSLFENTTDVDAIKSLVGLHAFRSRVASAMWNRALKRQVESGESDHVKTLVALINEPEVQDAFFEHETGLKSAGPEARALARARLVENFDRQFGPGGEAFREVLTENLDRFTQEYAEHTVEIGVSSSELLIGDVPALTVDHSTHTVGFLAGATLDSADTLFMPVGPRHVAALGGQGGYQTLAEATTSKLNHLQLISAQRKAYAVPGSTLQLLAQEERLRRQQLRATSETSISGPKTR